MLMRRYFLVVGTWLIATAGCTLHTTHKANQPPAENFNPLAYFEIPVTDLDRAVRFYTAVFGYGLERDSIDGNAVALFPSAEGAAGATGALVKGSVYKPAKDGAILYFRTANIDIALQKAVSAGGSVLYPKTDIGNHGFVAEFADSEGNRIALLQPLP